MPVAQPVVDQGQQPAGGGDRNAIPLYDFPRQRVVNHLIKEMPLRVSALRTLGAYGNVFAVESFMDELALAAGADPVAFRLRHLRDERAKDVIRAAAKLANWKPAARPGIGYGVGYSRYKNDGAYCAAVAEIEGDADIRVKKLWLATDVGEAINPDGVINQVEGGAVQSASWTLREQVRFDRDRITSAGWDSYPILRFTQAPEVVVRIMDAPDDAEVGAGEIAQGPVAGAVGNAVAEAVGVRVRDLPLTRERVARAIEES